MDNGAESRVSDAGQVESSVEATVRRMMPGLARSIGRTAWALPAVLFTAAAFAQAPAKPDPAAGEKIATEVCAACHGADGNSTAPANPKLAAQHAAYLHKQLKDFKPAGEGKPAARVNPVMAGFAAPLSEQDMLNLAAYYSAKELKPATARNKELADLGREIYRGGIAEKGVPACAGCHGPTGSGIPVQYPRVAGQYSDYTESQLVAFRAGTRGNNAAMATIASRLSDREIKAVSDYIAGLR
jgi:cytochrome c553